MKKLALVSLIAFVACNSVNTELKPVTMLVSNRYNTDGHVDSGATSVSSYYWSKAFQVRGFKSVVDGKEYYFGEEKQPLDSALIVWQSFPYNYHESPEYKKYSLKNK